MNKNWIYQNPNPKLQKELSESLDVHPVVAQLLINRGITEVAEGKQFLHGTIDQLHDPALFKDIDKFKRRIELAQKNQEHILVYGDYDVDGVTSSTILTKYLKKDNPNVSNHIPHRMSEGYGLNHEIAQIARAKGVTLLITVDCGITSVEEVNTLNEAGIDVIIVDHHMPGEEIPKACAIINPKQKDCQYPFKELAAVGVVAKLLHALHGSSYEEMFDFVALGTVADIVPLRGENRIFVKHGLLKMLKTKNLGLSALMDVAKINRSKGLSPYHIGFMLGPRINAAGRMDSAHKSLDLFLTEDNQEASELASNLDKCNTQRQKLQRDVVAQALEIAEEEIDFKNEKVIVLSKEGWHKGVLGIVASRLADKYYRPSVVISVTDGIGTASCRSIKGFHLHQALENCSSCLETFGGHAGAAGLTIKQENIAEFKELINKYAYHDLDTKKLVPSLNIDIELPLNYCSLSLAEIVDSMQPFGEGNPEPVFSTRRITVKGNPQVLGKETLKFWVTDGVVTLSAIGFRMGQYSSMLHHGVEVDLAYNLSIDDWNKAPTPQLKLKDFVLSD